MKAKKNILPAKLILSIFCILTLPACNTMQTNRAVTGAALGGAAGVGISAIGGGDLATGAVLGAATGAAVGAITAPQPRHYRRHPKGYYKDRYYYDY